MVWESVTIVTTVTNLSRTTHVLEGGIYKAALIKETNASTTRTTCVSVYNYYKCHVIATDVVSLLSAMQWRG